MICINAGTGRSFVDFVQQSGRVARAESAVGFSVLLYSDELNSKNQTFFRKEIEDNVDGCLGASRDGSYNFQQADLKAMMNYSTSMEECCRSLISRYMDGTHLHIPSCIGTHSLCDFCLRYVPRFGSLCIGGDVTTVSYLNIILTTIGLTPHEQAFIPLATPMSRNTTLSSVVSDLTPIRLEFDNSAVLERTRRAEENRMDTSTLCGELATTRSLLHSNCLICLVFKGKLSAHHKTGKENHVGVCPSATDFIHAVGFKCYTCCQMGHGSSGCANKFSITFNQCCFRCTLPDSIDGFSFHERNEFGNHCKSNKVESVRLLSLTMHSLQVQSQVEYEFPSLSGIKFPSREFTQWCSQSSDRHKRILNISLLIQSIVDLLKTYKGLSKIVRCQKRRATTDLSSPRS